VVATSTDVPRSQECAARRNGSVNTKKAMSLPKIGSAFPNGTCSRKRARTVHCPDATDPMMTASSSPRIKMPAWTIWL
jgi:hypothetical protein